MMAPMKELIEKADNSPYIMRPLFNGVRITAIRSDERNILMNCFMVFMRNIHPNIFLPKTFRTHGRVHNLLHDNYTTHKDDSKIALRVHHRSYMFSDLYPHCEFLLK